MDRREVTRNLVLALVATLVCLGILEGAARLFSGSNPTFNVNIGGFKEYHPTRREQLKKNYRAGKIVINALGLPGGECALKPTPGTVRVLCIGNSVTFSPPGANYPHFLQTHLRAACPGVPIEVITAAVPGYSSGQALDWYNEFLHELEADVAVIYLGWNDMGQFHPFGLRYKNEGLYRPRTLSGWAMENFHLLRMPYYFAGRIERARPVDLAPLTEEEARRLGGFTPRHYEENLRQLITRLVENATTPYLLSLAGLVGHQPTESERARMHFPRGMHRKLAIYEAVYAAYDRSLRNLAAETATPLIDLEPLIQTPQQRTFFTDTMHIDAQGAAAFAEQIATVLGPHIR